MWTPHPVIVTIMDNKDYIRVLLYSLLYHYYRVGGPPKRFLKPSQIPGRIQQADSPCKAIQPIHNHCIV